MFTDVNNGDSGAISRGKINAGLQFLTTNETDILTISGKEDAANKDVANGYAGLDGSGKINPTQLPPIAITNTFVVANQTAMLALIAQTGDIAIRTDLSQTFILQGSNPSILANWVVLAVPADLVSSVYGRFGAVTAQNGDYSTTQVTEGTNLYYTNARFDTQLALKTTSDLAEGSNLYYTDVRFDNRFMTKTTTHLAEGTNLYFTNARSIASPLTGYVSGAGVLSAADSILQAIQKLNGNVAASLLVNKESVFCYDTTTQSVGVANVFQDITFNTNVTLSGFTHTAGTSIFTATEAGLFLIKPSMLVNASGGAALFVEFRILKNGVEIVGSQIFMEVNNNNISITANDSIAEQLSIGDIIRIQMTSDKTSGQILTGQGNSTTKPSAKLTIIKLQ